jgi:hypothetical protein
MRRVEPVLLTAVDAYLDVLHAPFKLRAPEVSVSTVHRLELASVEYHQRFREQILAWALT